MISYAHVILIMKAASLTPFERFPILQVVRDGSKAVCMRFAYANLVEERCEMLIKICFVNLYFYNLFLVCISHDIDTASIVQHTIMSGSYEKWEAGL